MVEVRSSSNRNARVDDLEDLDDNYDRAKEIHGEADSKLLVFNGMYARDAGERKAHPAFGQPVVGEAKKRGIGLLSTGDLLGAIEARRAAKTTAGQFIQALGKPGLFRPPWQG
jgi:hypothetical protein